MKKHILFFLALLLLTGCGRKDTPQQLTEAAAPSQTTAAAVQSAPETWEWPVYEMEKTVVYDNNGVLISIDAIRQMEDDPSLVSFTYTIENRNSFRIKVDIFDAMVNGYSTNFDIIGAKVDPGETVTRDSRFSLRVPKGYRDIVIHFRNGVLHNASRYEDIDRTLEFTVCTTGGDPNMEFTYPRGTPVTENGGIRVENLGYLEEEDSILFIVFNDSEEDLSSLSIKPTGINGTDVSEAENTPFYQYSYHSVRAHSAYVVKMQLNPDFQREFPEIRQVKNLTANISWKGSTTFEATGVEIPVDPS